MSAKPHLDETGNPGVDEISDAQLIFENYLDGYLEGLSTKVLEIEMKQDIRMMRRIIAKISEFRERMEKLHGIKRS